MSGREASGCTACTVTGGVRNVNERALAIAPPVADVVPAGTVTVNSVAIGRRSTWASLASNRSVCVPTHRQWPGTAGEIVAGTAAASSWATVATGTIGWLNVSVTNGAIGTSPSGCTRITSSGPADVAGAGAGGPAGGNGVCVVAPARGTASDCVGQLKFFGSAASSTHAGSRATIGAMASALSSVPATTGVAALPPAPDGTPALSSTASFPLAPVTTLPFPAEPPPGSAVVPVVGVDPPAGTVVVGPASCFEPPPEHEATSTTARAAVIGDVQRDERPMAPRPPTRRRRRSYLRRPDRAVWFPR